MPRLSHELLVKTKWSVPLAAVTPEGPVRTYCPQTRDPRAPDSHSYLANGMKERLYLQRKPAKGQIKRVHLRGRSHCGRGSYSVGTSRGFIHTVPSGWRGTHTPRHTCRPGGECHPWPRAKAMWRWPCHVSLPRHYFNQMGPQAPPRQPGGPEALCSEDST